MVASAVAAAAAAAVGTASLKDQEKNKKNIESLVKKKERENHLLLRGAFIWVPPNQLNCTWVYVFISYFLKIKLFLLPGNREIFFPLLVSLRKYLL